MEELSQLGRYQLTRVLGRGAMGVVYEGIDPKLNRQIAVKTILKGHISDPELEAEYSARFIREAQAVARLNHPNIVTVFDFGEENDIAFIVMECIRGEELKTHFDEKHPFSLEDAVRMTGELLDALDYAHQNGIVHRDIKPANVMLDGQNRVKLTDFGVARLSDTNTERTQAGTMVGTPSYMSPEQIEGSAVGPRSDIFAVGIILYQFLTGEKPFHAQGMWAIQKKIMQEDPVLPSVMNPALSPAFDAVVLRALAKKPDDRYPTALDFKKDLQRALAGEALEDLDATRMVIRPRPQSNAIQQPGEGSSTRNTVPP
ncbi:MAG: serine/threonine protein kinase, partial [Burkholderiales bacterium]|nr:serine/threonine protein kinase [Burkholderiales bacterium]